MGSMICRSPTGSSPRMRGAPVPGRRHDLRPGIIPAYAGSTSVCRGWRRMYWDHPRVCGEHCRLYRLTAPCRGSSPRMRGALAPVETGHDLQGIIPAYAGSTLCFSMTRVMAGDHPRVCGEHKPYSTSTLERSGSSPRMRGALKRNWDQHRAGGSSPRMRGAPVVGVVQADASGIIPAYAGSTVGLGKTIHQAEDHPRVCGEHGKMAFFSVVVRGSSPRMRGAPCRTTGADWTRRIIPAYAGSTFRPG